jgi:hypothetical protein
MCLSGSTLWIELTTGFIKVKMVVEIVIIGESD